MAPTIDRAIEALARKQHGAFNIHQVHRLGGLAVVNVDVRFEVATQQIAGHNFLLASTLCAAKAPRS